MDFTTVKGNLEKNGFQVSVFETAKEAADYLDKEIDGATIGIGGSVTIQDMGLYDLLSKHNDIYWHWNNIPGLDKQETYKRAQVADIYFSSVNGLAETGEIINIDGTCNRVSAIMYGHKKVYLIVGANKLAPDYDSALYRARNIAAPLNAQRLNRKTPCAEKADKCYNCTSPDRICNGLSVLWKKPGGSDFEVVLINENLGY
ncbi:MAG: lactate utilization protein [Lachnospiraceae bacterium]|nr:lactate utilization protein [Lachnospiraceae bacterium]